MVRAANLISLREDDPQPSNININSSSFIVLVVNRLVPEDGLLDWSVQVNVMTSGTLSRNLHLHTCQP